MGFARQSLVHRPGRPLVVDGGLATGLEALGYELHPRLWSAGVFLEHPAAVERLHRAYLDAGAEILISASYQMSFAGLAREGLDHRSAARAMRRTVEVARRAAARAGKRPLVAASIGPYGATLADGSEYRGAYGLDVAQLVEFHRERASVLDRAGADLLAAETVPCLDEARALIRLFSESPGTPVWVSFSCGAGGRLRDGQPLERAAALLERCARVQAVGVNCTAPDHVAEAIDAIRTGTGKPVIVYPNSGEQWEPARRAWVGEFDRRRFLDLASTWARRGVWAIGGCCRIGPDVIRELAQRLRE